MSFHPAGEPAPVELRTARVRLMPLRASDVDRDYDAVMSSRAELRAWSASTWPAEDFTRAENLADLERHAREHDAGEAFTYTVLEADSERCVGCVYVVPLGPEEDALLGPPVGAREERRARVTFWVRASEVPHDLDRHLFAALRGWFETAWAFDRVVFSVTPGNARQQALLREAGLRELGECTIGGRRTVRVFEAPRAAAPADPATSYAVERRTRLVIRPDFKLTEIRIAPDQVVPWHTHTHVPEVLYVLAGEVRLSLRAPDDEVRLRPGECHRLDAGRPHRVANAGAVSATFLVLQGMGAYDYVPVDAGAGAPGKGPR